MVVPFAENWMQDLLARNGAYYRGGLTVPNRTKFFDYIDCIAIPKIHRSYSVIILIFTPAVKKKKCEYSARTK